MQLLFAAEGLALDRLSTDSLGSTLDEAMLLGRALLNETHGHTQADQPQVEPNREGRGAAVVVEGAVVVQADALRQPHSGEGPAQDELIVLDAGVRGLQTGQAIDLHPAVDIAQVDDRHRAQAGNLDHALDIHLPLLMGPLRGLFLRLRQFAVPLRCPMAYLGTAHSTSQARWS